jgi:tryptophan synthase beta chain
MNYRSVVETAADWKVNERRVRVLLDQGRIPGAMKVGRSWMIPEDAAKPLDARTNPSGRGEVNVKERYDVDFRTYMKKYPDDDGFFGRFGGAYVPKGLEKALKEIYDGYLTICKSAKFIGELRRIRSQYQGRPTPVYHCERLSNYLGKAQIYLKREDLNHTGAHKINHTMGEVMLAKYLGKTRVIAETGAGQHGVAVATAAAYFGLKCEIYMGVVDMAKQAPNVARMKILGARVVPVKEGAGCLKEAVDAAFVEYMKTWKNTFYAIGSAVGPNPFPMMVRDFQSIVGQEAKEQFVQMTGELPDIVCACVGGGSNSIGMFEAFLPEPVEIVGVEPLGRGPKLGDNAASMAFGSEGVMHGFNSMMIKDKEGGPGPVYSVASGLDYPSVGPEHAFLHELGRVNYDVVTDKEALDAFFMLSRLEGIIPALESAHAVAYAIRRAKQMKHGSILVNLSGRGDKDIDYVIEHYGKDYGILD